MKKKTVAFYLLIISLFLVSCSKKDFSVYFNSDSIDAEKIESTHQWYSFTNDNFVKIDKPENAVSSPFQPWTEAIRLSFANTFDGKSLALVNRLGILSFDDDKISLSKDVTVFGNRTVGSLFFADSIPMFTVYKSSFFNESIKHPEYKYDKSQHFFLVQYDLNSKICYPVINCNNLIEPAESEIVDYICDGRKWLCNVKTINDGKIKFSYLSWTPTVPLASLSPVTASSGISINEIDKEDFRNLKQNIDFTKAPERIQKLLTGVSDKIPFLVELKEIPAASPKIYKNKAGSNKMSELKVCATMTENWSGALFEDGTFYFEGGVEGRHIVRGGRPVVLRLPKLTPGYAYTDFVISGNYLYAGWEERSFYKVSRSGFLSVNLDKTLYNEIN